MNKIKNWLLDLTYNNLTLYSKYKIMINKEYGKSKKFELRDAIVCGMPRSGSTLVYNIVKMILQEKINNTDIYFYRDKQLNSIYRNEISLLVKKNHRFSPFLVSRVKRGTTIGFFTHRDIRDVVVSMTQKGWIIDFDLWIKERKLKKIVNDSLLYAKTKNMIVIKYEDLMSQRVKIIEKIAVALQEKLNEDQINHILNETDINAARKKISQLEGDVDRESHLHKNHIRDGEIGKWERILTKNQIDIINNDAKDYLHYFGYKI